MFYGARGDLGIVMFFKIQYRYVTAVSRKQHRKRPANTTVTASYQRNPSSETASAQIAEVPFRLRAQGRFITRQVIFVHLRDNVGRALTYDAVPGVNDGGSLAGKDASDMSSTSLQSSPG